MRTARRDLLTITDANQQFFEQLCDEVYVFAGKYFAKQPLRNFYPQKEVEVYWWEKSEDKERFHLSIEEKNIEKKQLSTFRESLLKKSEPKPKKQAKPSRLRMLISFDKNDEENISLVRKYSVQKGIIYWLKSPRD